MGRPKQELTKELIDEWLVVNPDGRVFWKKSPKYDIAEGSPAGYTRDDGYIHLLLKGNNILLHRLVFFYFNGYFPELVDHIDRDTTNNHPDNLADSSKSLNGMNRGVQINNKLGIQGVCKNPNGSYTAYGKVKGVYERHTCPDVQSASVKRKDIERRRIGQ